MTESMDWGRGKGPSPTTVARRRAAQIADELEALMSTPGPGGWAARGACRDVDPELMFPVARRGSRAHAEQVRAAREVCIGCPVRSQCLAYALEVGEDAGVWGGLDEDERRALRRGSGEEAA